MTSGIYQRHFCNALNGAALQEPLSADDATALYNDIRRFRDVDYIPLINANRNLGREEGCLLRTLTRIEARAAELDQQIDEFKAIASLSQQLESNNALERAMARRWKKEHRLSSDRIEYAGRRVDKLKTKINRLSSAAEVVEDLLKTSNSSPPQPANPVIEPAAPTRIRKTPVKDTITTWREAVKPEVEDEQPSSSVSNTTTSATSSNSMIIDTDNINDTKPAGSSPILMGPIGGLLRFCTSLADVLQIPSSIRRFDDDDTTIWGDSDSEISDSQILPWVDALEG